MQTYIGKHYCRLLQTYIVDYCKLVLLTNLKAVQIHLKGNGYRNEVVTRKLLLSRQVLKYKLFSKSQCLNNANNFKLLQS